MTQRVVLFFVAILSVVRASPFGLDQDNRLNPLWNILKFEKVDLGKYASTDGSVPDLHNLFGDSDYCPAVGDDIPRIPDDPCVYVAQNNVRIVKAIAVKNLDSLTSHGIEECSDATNNIYEVENSCFRYNDKETVYFISVFNESAIQEINGVAAKFGDLDLCDLPFHDQPGQRCVLVGYGNMHLMNVLTLDNIDDVKNTLKSSDFTKCVIDKRGKVITTEQCYSIGNVLGEDNYIQFFNVNKRG